MTNKNLILNGHTFTNERMARNLAALADLCVFLDLDKCSDARIVAHLTTVKVRKTENLDVAPELNVRSDDLELGMRLCHATRTARGR